MKHLFLFLAFGGLLLSTSCSNTKSTANSAVSGTAADIVGPDFSADSAYAFCEAQCSFGPRTMNSEAHERCGQWIADKFRSYGLEVIEQRVTLKGFDGTPLKSNNIIASINPELTNRVIICAHWDSRPWADNDPDEANWTKPVMAANDGASGVAVMLELARIICGPVDQNGLLHNPSEQELPDSVLANSPLLTLTSTLKRGIDFICFDAEDWGNDNYSDSWALGAQYWAAHPHREGYTARFGILLDMVGGQGARFYQEGFSLYYAPEVVNKVWKAAQTVGYSSFFPKKEGSTITDDHGPVNSVAGIPCIDIIPYYPDCKQSGFGPTWHTVNDDMAHIDPNTLKAVGQALVQVIFEK